MTRHYYLRDIFSFDITLTEWVLVWLELIVCLSSILTVLLPFNKYSALRQWVPLISLPFGCHAYYKICKLEKKSNIIKARDLTRNEVVNNFFSTQIFDKDVRFDEGIELEYYDWNNAVDEAVGFIISGNSGSGKTSVASWLAGLLTQDNSAQVLALDPHFNDIWEEIGIKSIGEFNEIEFLLNWCCQELDKRRGRKKQKEFLGDNLIVFCDEVNACLESFSDPKKIQSAIKRLGSEGRKFGITFIILNQSHNAEDLGVTKKMLNNYFLITLGASARALVNENFKSSNPIKQEVLNTAYPCCISGSMPIQIAKHPTHHTYKKFKKHGNPPLNLLPINQLPLTIPLPDETTSIPVEIVENDLEDIEAFRSRLLDNFERIEVNFVICPHCESTKTVRNGGGRRKCKDCHKTFKELL